VLRRFSRGLQFQAAWTWSHAIDNQGDPLVSTESAVRGFQHEFDSQGDRGDADFDQRHNLILNWLWRTPGHNRWTGGWQFAGLAGYRTGFPFTVVTNYFGSTPAGELLVLPTANFTGPGTGPARPTDGGVVLLDPSHFSIPSSGVGDTTRGEFRGPGFWNYDASLAREFRAPWLGESGHLQLRAEWFNLFNHANLGSPDPRLTSPTFGIAFFGRQAATSTAVGTSPLNDMPRSIQMVLRLSF
jgi:hypothetical protein